MIEQVTKMHQDWVRMAVSLGAGDYAEDIVQESYIRLLKYASTDALIKNGKVNKMYMWVTLRNCLNTHRTKNKFQSVEFNENHLTESYSQEDGDRDLAFGRLEGLIDNEVDSWHWYDKMLFKIYRESGKSIRKLSAETGISVRSIWKTLKDCKDRIEENVGEDYIDYKNEDYELIEEI